MTKGSIIWYSVIFLLIQNFYLYAQEKPDLQKLMPKRFIDKVEIIVAPSLNFPNDHGYSTYIKNAPSSAPATDELKLRIGYSAGLGLAHSIRKRFELNSRVLLERKGYNEEITVDGGINKFHKGVYNTHTDYFTISFLPRIYFGENLRTQLFSGAYCSWLLKSFRKEYTYLNGQVTQVTSTTNDPSMHKYEVGVCVGWGYSFRLGQSNALVMQMQGNYGLSDIVNVNRVRITNNSLSLSVTYRHNQQFEINHKTN